MHLIQDTTVRHRHTRDLRSVKIYFFDVRASRKINRLLVASTKSGTITSMNLGKHTVATKCQRVQVRILISKRSVTDFDLLKPCCLREISETNFETR